MKKLFEWNFIMFISVDLSAYAYAYICMYVSHRKCVCRLTENGYISNYQKKIILFIISN